MGGDQELIARLRTPEGETWGAVSFYREPGAPMFDETDKVFIEHLTPHLARGARTALLFGEAIDPDSPDAPGLLMLNEAFKVHSATAESARWLEELPDGDSTRGRLPASVLAVAGAALDIRALRAARLLGCSLGPVPGCCCTGRFWKAAKAAELPSSSSPPTPRGSTHC